MSEQELIKESDYIESSISIAHKTNNNRPTLHWRESFDFQDNINYEIEFDGVIYNDNFSIQNGFVKWKVPFDLTLNKIYPWKVRAFDGYEYSQWSDYGYLLYSNVYYRDLVAFTNVDSKNVKNATFNKESIIEVKRTEFLKNLESEIYVGRKKEYLLSEIDVSLKNGTYQNSEISIKKRIHGFLYSQIYINTRKISPPKPPLTVCNDPSFDAKINTILPLFSWYKSNDELFGYEISYELEIDSSQSFLKPEVSIKNIKNPISQKMIYDLDISDKLDEGFYYWRVRAFDGINYSEWVYGNRFFICPKTLDFLAQLFVTKKFTRDLKYAEMYIRPKENLNSEINVWGKENLFKEAYATIWKKNLKYLDSYIYIFRDVGYVQKESNIFIRITESINSEIEILIDGKHYREQSLNTFLDVFPVSDSELESNITIYNKKENDLSCVIDIFKLKTQCSINSYLKVIKPNWKNYGDLLRAYVSVKNNQLDLHKINEIESRIVVNKRTFLFSELCSEIKIIEPSSFLLANVFILDENPKPDIPKIYCNIDSDNWHDDKKIIFWWDEPKIKKNKISGYVLFFDMNKETIPILGKDYYEYSNGIKIYTVDMNNFDYSGEYWFHLRAFSDKYKYSDVSNYKIKYNNIPSEPKNLKINGNNFNYDKNLISYNNENNFSWDFSYDLDLNDNNLLYRIQISKDPNFTENILDIKDISGNEQKIIFSNIVNEGGIYYWRVSCNDGKQESRWSKIQSFMINNPPSEPSDLSFKPYKL